MPSQGRVNRIAQRIKEELSTLMLFEVSDPRLANVFITHVKVDRELAFQIFMSLRWRVWSEVMKSWKVLIGPRDFSAASFLSRYNCVPSRV